MVTAGDVVFYGTMDGWFKALDARNGNLLWQFKTGSGIIGQPVTYKGPDGKQYIAILSRRRRMVRRGRRGRTERAGWNRRFGIRECHGGSAQVHDERRNALCFRAALVSVVFVLRIGALVAAESATLRVCADPNNLPFSNQAERDLRTGWRD